MLAQQEANKLRPTDSVNIDNQATTLVEETASRLQKKISSIKQATLEDPILQLQKKAFENQYGMIKQHLLDQPEIKELKGFDPLIEICTLMKIEPRWAISAALLSTFEYYIKQWLIDNTDETIESLKILPFHKLTEKLQARLTRNNINADHLELSGLTSIREYRNMVLHDMHVPSEVQIDKIKNRITELTKYIELLK